MLGQHGMKMAARGKFELLAFEEYIFKKKINIVDTIIEIQ
jgi:hypothetical protein